MEKLPSNKLSIKAKDFLNGFFFALATSLVATIGQTLELGIIPQWEQIRTALLSGLGAGIVYVLRKFISDHVKNAEKTLQEERQKQADKLKKQ